MKRASGGRRLYKFLFCIRQSFIFFPAGEVSRQNKSVLSVDFAVAVDISRGFVNAFGKGFRPFCEPPCKQQPVTPVHNPVAVNVSDDKIGIIVLVIVSAVDAGVQSVTL